MSEEQWVGDDEHQCAKCGTICQIDADGVRSVAWCDVCETYAEGFDGADWWSESQAAEADFLVDQRKEGVR